jgi:phosphate transport system substrate-binding protein
MRKLSVLIGTLALASACGRPEGAGGNKAAADSGAAKGEDEGGSKRSVIQNKGSDTLVNVAQAWAEEYAKVEPNTAIAVTGGGSGTGISAMINGTVDIANASRKMKDKEKDAAKKNGIDPIEHIVGNDALAVFVHKDNPMSEATIAQLSDIYRERGPVDKWSQLGITVPGCDSDEIVRVSRQNNSGTYAYFKKAVLGKGNEYKLGSRDMHGSKDVVDLVEKTPCAIGYSGLAYATEHIKMPCVKKDDAAECVAPAVKTASDGTYAIARPLLMYTAGKPEGAIGKYLEWVLSDAGQCIILDKGYAPVRDVTCK